MMRALPDVRSHSSKITKRTTKKTTEQIANKVLSVL
jgi:hypothetical protein